MGLEEDFGPSQGFVTILVSCRQRGHGPLCLPLSTEVAAAGSSCQFLSWPGAPCPVSCPSSAPHIPPVPLTAWGQRAAVGAQSVTAPLNRVLSLCLSLSFFPPHFASCCLQSLGTLSPYSQVMPLWALGSVTCCCHTVSLCPGALLVLPWAVGCPRVWGHGGNVVSFRPQREQDGPRVQLLPRGGKHQ